MTDENTSIVEEELTNGGVIGNEKSCGNANLRGYKTRSIPVKKVSFAVLRDKKIERRGGTVFVDYNGTSTLYLLLEKEKFTREIKSESFDSLYN